MKHLMCLFGLLLIAVTAHADDNTKTLGDTLTELRTAIDSIVLEEKRNEAHAALKIAVHQICQYRESIHSDGSECEKIELIKFYPEYYLSQGNLALVPGYLARNWSEEESRDYYFYDVENCVQDEIYKLPAKDFYPTRAIQFMNDIGIAEAYRISLGDVARIKLKFKMIIKECRENDKN